MDPLISIKPDNGSRRLRKNIIPSTGQVWSAHVRCFCPLLFKIYIKHMPNAVSEDTSKCLFADDCLAYKQITTIEEKATLQKDLNSVPQWAF